jgi:ATP-dependent protease ClpP protease subunit
LRRKRHHITILCLGEAASMGGVLLQAGNTRVMGRNAFLMIHEVAYDTYGKSANHRDELALVKKMESKLLRILAHRSEFNVREMRSRWERKDWWLDAKEALSLGFIDKIE